jgi:hypothetical protein
MKPFIIAPAVRLTHPEALVHRQELVPQTLNQQYGSMYRVDLKLDPDTFAKVTKSLFAERQKIGRALRPRNNRISIKNFDGSAGYEVYDEKIGNRVRYVTKLYSHGMFITRLVSKRRKLAIAKGQDWLI